MRAENRLGLKTLPVRCYTQRLVPSTVLRPPHPADVIGQLLIPIRCLWRGQLVSFPLPPPLLRVMRMVWGGVKKWVRSLPYRYADPALPRHHPQVLVAAIILLSLPLPTRTSLSVIPRAAGANSTSTILLAPWTVTMP
jgi:hypothetical protein